MDNCNKIKNRTRKLAPGEICERHGRIKAASKNEVKGEIRKIGG